MSPDFVASGELPTAVPDVEGVSSCRLFDSAQRIVLVGANWQVARHFALQFRKDAASCRFLAGLKCEQLCPTPAAVRGPKVQLSLGFTRRGLENVGVPRHVLTCFALKSPAFCGGAQVRANRHLSLSDRDAPRYWDKAFDFTTLDAVFSIHACDRASLAKTMKALRMLASDCGVRARKLVSADRLDKPPKGEEGGEKISWVHFGYRDGLSRVAVKGWTSPAKLGTCKPGSIHAAGEFLLGHAQDSGANPWIAGPGVRVWPEELRSFFFNGSFGVLHQIEQHVPEFENFVKDRARASGIDARELKAKMCGRFPDGRPLAMPKAQPLDDFDYSEDTKGYGCPFGSHVRRLNPREEGVAAQGFRTRAIMRRGIPYGPAWDGKTPDDVKRGLMAQFFCTSIEDQFEHLVGQWADRVPMGSPDRGTARDPLMGAHQVGDGPFEIPVLNRSRPIKVNGMQPFVRTVGVAYLFYPSLSTLDGMARCSIWHCEEKED